MSPALHSQTATGGDLPLPTAAAGRERLPVFTQAYHEDQAATRAELMRGLEAPAPFVAPKFLYDALGSRLFDAITELPEYYPTRTEAAIVAQHGAAMAEAIGPVGSLVDLGAGSCTKALRLLPLLQPQRYVAVDISVEYLRESLLQVQRLFPQLHVAGVGLDFSTALELPPASVQGRPVYFYAGSSIGNFTPAAAAAFLAGVRAQAAGGGVLIGVDLVKPADVLEPAYDDALGVTSAFNLNLLLHLNRLIGSDFSLRDWRHVALFNSTESRIEMHLEARRPLSVTWQGGARRFAAGERLHTENSYKYTLAGFQALLRSAGLNPAAHWTDARDWFAVFWASA
jgi:dimethylhistidine N-methyltransferase